MPRNSTEFEHPREPAAGTAWPQGNISMLNGDDGEGSLTPKPMQAKSMLKDVEDVKVANVPAPDPLGREAPLIAAPNLSPFNTELFRIDPKRNTVGVSREILSAQAKQV